MSITEPPAAGCHRRAPAVLPAAAPFPPCSGTEPSTLPRWRWGDTGGAKGRCSGAARGAKQPPALAHRGCPVRCTMLLARRGMGMRAPSTALHHQRVPGSCALSSRGDKHPGAAPSPAPAPRSHATPAELQAETPASSLLPKLLQLVKSLGRINALAGKAASPHGLLTSGERRLHQDLK